MQHTLWTVQRSDPDYPPLLAQISDPPNLLYGLGNRDLLSTAHAIAIVGTRKSSNYGTQVLHDIIPMLTLSGIVTVSGLAFGIDAAVHSETIHSGGQTIAVLGSPVHLDEIHPRGQQWLARRILDSGGLLLSEYAPRSPVRKHHFPARNRIIAGLCSATVVIEAPTKSGALITADFALNENREVFAVPGSIYSSLSTGCNRLIEYGATPLLSCQQFRDELELLSEFSINRYDIESSIQLTEDERVIVRLLSDEPLCIDTIIERSQFSTSRVIQLITTLSLRGILKDVGENLYSL